MGHKNHTPITLNWQTTDPKTGFLPLNAYGEAGGSIPSGTAGGAMASTNTIYSQIMNLCRFDNLGLELDWTSTPVGTFTVYGSVSGKSFYDITSLWTNPSITNPSGSNSGTLGAYNQCPWKFVYIKYTNSSSSGTLTGYLQAKDLN